MNHFQKFPWLWVSPKLRALFLKTPHNIEFSGVQDSRGKQHDCIASDEGLVGCSNTSLFPFSPSCASTHLMTNRKNHPRVLECHLGKLLHVIDSTIPKPETPVWVMIQKSKQYGSSCGSWKGKAGSNSKGKDSPLFVHFISKHSTYIPSLKQEK